MKDTIQFDLPRAEWRKSLEEQPHQNSQFFEVPMSVNGMAYFKNILEVIGKRSIKIGEVSGIYKFIHAVKEDRAKRQMIAWLESFTPIRTSLRGGHLEHFFVVEKLRNSCSLIDGMTVPFYSMREGLNVRVGNQNRFDDQLKPVFNVLQAAVTEFEFQKKMVKLSVNKFFLDRTIENRNSLIAEIYRIPLGEIGKKGQSFLQGGAVGSKR